MFIWVFIITFLKKVPTFSPTRGVITCSTISGKLLHFLAIRILAQLLLLITVWMFSSTLTTLYSFQTHTIWFSLWVYSRIFSVWFFVVFFFPYHLLVLILNFYWCKPESLWVRILLLHYMFKTVTKMVYFLIKDPAFLEIPDPLEFPQIFCPGISSYFSLFVFIHLCIRCLFGGGWVSFLQVSYYSSCLMTPREFDFWSPKLDGFLFP